jgi:hypothetical protein
MRNKQRCKNCINFEENSTRVGICKLMKIEFNYRFAYNDSNEENYNSDRVIQYPEVKRYMTCDRFEFKDRLKKLLN